MTLDSWTAQTSAHLQGQRSARQIPGYTNWGGGTAEEAGDHRLEERRIAMCYVGVGPLRGTFGELPHDQVKAPASIGTFFHLWVDNVQDDGVPRERGVE
jgi:hypothetical protein